MASLTIAQGPQAENAVPLKKRQFVIGRGTECDLILPNPAVSRRHACVIEDGGRYFLDDLNSSNGTLLNGTRVRKRMPLEDGDVFQISGVDFAFHAGAAPPPSDPTLESATGATEAEEPGSDQDLILAVLDAETTARSEQNAAAKLHAIARLSRNLGHSLDLDEVLSRVLESTLQVFPQADWATITLCESGDRLTPYAIRSRLPGRGELDTIHPISRTIAQRVLSEGVAVLSSDVQSDQRFAQSHSVLEFGLRSMMCAPLIGSLPRPLGLLTVDTQQIDSPFNETDLDVLVSLSRLCAQGMEYARLHERLLAEREQSVLSMKRSAAERQKLQEQLLSISEQEQRRIGQELHDDVGQELTALSFLLEKLSDDLKLEGSAYSEVARQIGVQARDTLRKVRTLSHGLVPVEVDSQTLGAALTRLTQQIDATQGPVCRYQCDESLPVMDSRTATQLYRIAQEAVTNAVKHSQAEHIDVQLSAQGDSVTLIVRDDGRGVSSGEELEPGLGLRSMHHRAALVGAELNIAPGEHGGTVVRCDVNLG